MTPEREKGLRLERVLENICRRGNGLLGIEGSCHNIKGNVQLHRSRRLYRQIDLAYDFFRGSRLYSVMAEAKYSSNGAVPSSFRTGPRKRHSILGKRVELGGPLEQAYEAALFGEFDYAVLATNSIFRPDLREACARLNHRLASGTSRLRELRLLERNELDRMHYTACGKGLDAGLAAVKVKYSGNKSVIYL